MQRRLMFLHYILNENKSSLIFKCFEAQRRNPCRNDWIISIYDDLEVLDIGLSFEDIQNLSKYQFQKFVRITVEEKALEYLNNLKLSHSKVELVEHKSLQMQKYLEPQNVETIKLSKFLFQARTRMLEVKLNFRNRYSKNDLQCLFECISEDSQKHLLLCKKVEPNQISNKIPHYEDLFSVNVSKQMELGRFLEGRYTKRRKLLSNGPRVNQ